MLLTTSILAGSLVFSSALASDPLPRRPGVPVETIAGVEVVLGEVTTAAGHRLRTITTRPPGEAKLPAILLVGWLSCDSVESPRGPQEGFARVLHGLAARSGHVLVRVEKPGVGDSEGPPCGDCDFRTELEGYRAALRAAKALPFVDEKRVFILGMSNGGGVAPLVGEGESVAGYVASGGWVKTWFEHMMEHERRKLTLSGRTPPGEASARMKSIAEFYGLYLRGKKTPAEVLAARPDLAPAWDDEPTRQYGRPAAFYHQLEELNLAEAWSRVDVPVLAIHGEFDWIMSADDARLIADIVNRNRAGLASCVIVPGMDHFYETHPSFEAAFRNAGRGKRADEEVVATVVEWLQAAR